MHVLPHKRDNLHHAYFVLVSERAKIIEKILADIEEGLNITTKANPDLIVWDHERFSMEHARELKKIVLNKPLETRIIILSVGHILSEAQNALLKIFEDPPTQTHFFIISETTSYLLPTLASRLFMHTYIDAPQKETDEKVTQFIEGDLGTKMKIAEEFADKGNEEARRFLDKIEVHFSSKAIEKQDILKKIIDAKEFLLLPSAHKKGLLEAIALTISK